MEKKLSAIVVVAHNGAIGKNGDLLCHLPADLKHFKAITMGHSIIMGRKTFESFPKGPLPGRQNIVVTRNTQYHPEGATIVHSVEQAIAQAEMPGEVFILGGAQLYKATINEVDTLYLTRLDHDFPEADAHFPALDMEQWEEIDREDHDPDEKNRFPYSFITLRRITKL